MTQKDYWLIAAAIKVEIEAIRGAHLLDEIDYDTATNRLTGTRLVGAAVANALEESNPRFDRKEFLRACGLE